MKTLVTGGAGFVGSHLVDRLANEGHEVICFDNFITGRKENIKNSKIKILQGDVNNKEDVRDLFKKHRFDNVFHYAALVGVKRTLETPLDVLGDVEGIKNILEAARKQDVKKVVFSSSSEVYGDPVEIPEKEDGHLNPKLPYAVVKLIGEKYLEAYHKKYGLNTTSLRFFNVYGPRQDSSDYGFVVGIFIKQALKNQPPTIYGDGTQTRDFVFIEDNINATLKTMTSRESNGQSINIGTGMPITIYNLAQKIIKLCGKNIEPVFVNNQREDVRHRFPEIKKMIDLLDYKPIFDLDRGLKKTIGWYKKEGK
ncbi:NAD-dependent epimerase/dehydratase family protein [Candidatus Woesearchaeota archaeon]|nr:NAD-dependent epimerase/dehydratase family protein [Candidatus Woesearchaeota archaeon]